MKSMKSDRLSQDPRDQLDRRHQSDAVTSLNPYLAKTNQSEVLSQKELLALVKLSQFRSSSWTGQREKKTRISTSYFHCFLGSSTS